MPTHATRPSHPVGRRASPLAWALIAAGLLMGGYLIIRSFTTSGPSHADLKEFEAEQAELRQFAPAPEEVRQIRGGAPG